MKTENKILELSFAFSLQIVNLFKVLIGKNEYVLPKQLRSVTSIGANVEEAIVGQSRKDFITKMSIAPREGRETRYWLRVLDKSRLIEIDYSSLLDFLEHIINILTKIVKTSRETGKKFNIQNLTFKIIYG